MLCLGLNNNLLFYNKEMKKQKIEMKKHTLFIDLSVINLDFNV